MMLATNELLAVFNFKNIHRRFSALWFYMFTSGSLWPDLKYHISLLITYLSRVSSCLKPVQAQQPCESQSAISHFNPICALLWLTKDSCFASWQFMTSAFDKPMTIIWTVSYLSLLFLKEHKGAH